MSPMMVPASSQTVDQATYSNVTRTVGASVEGATMRPGSRILVLIAKRSAVIADARAGISEMLPSPRLARNCFELQPFRNYTPRSATRTVPRSMFAEWLHDSSFSTVMGSDRIRRTVACYTAFAIAAAALARDYALVAGDHSQTHRLPQQWPGRPPPETAAIG